MSLLAELLLIEGSTPKLIAFELQQKLLEIGFEDVSIKLSDWRADPAKGGRDRGYLLQCSSDSLSALIPRRQDSLTELFYFDYWVWLAQTQSSATLKFKPDIIDLWQGPSPNPSENEYMVRSISYTSVAEAIASYENQRS